MGRGVIFIVFLVGFVIFTILKMIFVGTKAAYEAVFDPSAKDERIRGIIADCIVRVNDVMRTQYEGGLGELSILILHLTPMVQSYILERGYQTTAAIARGIVCDAIVIGGHATHEEVACA
jgi:hypothetical protein